MAGVLQHVAGEGHGQVEVHAEPGLVRGLAAAWSRGLQPLQHVDLLVDLPALGEPVQWLDHAGLDVGKAVQFEGVGEPVDDGPLDDALGGQELGESAQWSDLLGHGCLVSVFSRGRG